MAKLTFMHSIDGQMKNCEAICTYNDENNNKNYIIYTDNEIALSGKLNLYYAFYELDNTGHIIILPIEDNKDKKVALSIIDEILKSVKGDKNE